MGYKNFTVGIKRILKQVSPSVKISQISIDNLNTFANVFLIAIIHEIAKIMQNNMFTPHKSKRKRRFLRRSRARHVDRKIIKVRDVMAAVKIVLPGELAKHAVYDGNKAVRKFQEYNKERERKKKNIDERRQLWLQGKRASFPRSSKSSKSGIVLSVSRVESILRENLPKNVSEEAPIYLTAVLEYLLAELLELSSNAVHVHHRITITPTELSLITEMDDELNNLMTRLKFRFIGGGFENISPVYIDKINQPRKRKSRKRKSRKRKSRSPRRKSRSPRRKSRSRKRVGRAKSREQFRDSSSSSSAGAHAREALGL